MFWWNPIPWVSLFGVILIGFAAVPIFPGLMSVTIDRVEVLHTANTIGMQVSAAAYRDVPAARYGGCFSSQVGVGGDPTLCVWPVYIVNWAVYSIMP